MRFGSRLSLLLALLVTACSGVVPDIAPSAEKQAAALVASETPTPELTATAVPSMTPKTLTVGTVSYRGVRFQFDLGLASSVRGTIIPASQGITPDLDIPEHLRFIFDEIALSNAFNPREPQLLVFPVDDFRLASSTRTHAALEILNELRIEKPLELDQEITLMPPMPGKALFQIHARYLRFEQGEGIRFLTTYSDDSSPISNETLFYTFQGISANGEYYISLFFPISTQQLPDTVQDIEVSGEYPLFAASYDSYLADTIALLEGIPDRDFTPNLILLDNMIKSLQLPDASKKLRQVDDPEKLAERIRREGKAGLRTLWRDLGITSSLFEAPSQLNLELFGVKFNESRDEYHLLLISDSVELDWQYLLFRSVGNRWLFVGHIDLGGQKFLPPACRIVQDKNEAWWVLTWLEEYGPGVTHYRETWYRFGEDGLHAVWSYPLEGYQISPDFAYNVLYRVDLAPEEDDQSSSFRLIYHLSYSIYGDEESRTASGETYNLFEIERSVLYTWFDGEQRFTLVPESSQLTQDQIDAVFYFPGPDIAFLQFAGQELSLLAQNGSALQKGWLIHFLDSLESGLEVEELRNRIGG
jgi:hypothetical protein